MLSYPPSLKDDVVSATLNQMSNFWRCQLVGAIGAHPTAIPDLLSTMWDDSGSENPTMSLKTISCVSFLVEALRIRNDIEGRSGILDAIVECVPPESGSEVKGITGLLQRLLVKADTDTTRVQLIELLQHLAQPTGCPHKVC